MDKLPYRTLYSLYLLYLLCLLKNGTHAKTRHTHVKVESMFFLI